MLHGDAGQKTEMCKHRLSRDEASFIEGMRLRRAQSPRFKERPLGEEQQRLIQIQKPWPHQVFFFREHVAGLANISSA